MSTRKDRYEAALSAAQESFDSRELAEKWLRSYVRGLGAKPVSLLDDDEGLAAVIQIIGRLEHGIFT